MDVAANASPVVTDIEPQWLDPATYVSFLNRVFPGQWRRADYDWYMARAFNGVRSEILVRAEGTRIVSGVALCRRQISVGAGTPIDVGILSGAATLPTERGCGHYLSLVLAARERSREKGYAALLGFVTRDNASGRGLMRLGAHAIRSFYIVSPDRERGRAELNGRRVLADRQRFRAPFFARSALEFALTLAAKHDIDAPGASRLFQAHFHYEQIEDWRQQFVHRPNPVRAIRIAHDSVALVESVGETDRVQWLACPRRRMAACLSALAASSLRMGRKFFMYTLDSDHAAAARRAGLGVRGGYLMLLRTGASSESWDRLVNATWFVHSGDRI